MSKQSLKSVNKQEGAITEFERPTDADAIKIILDSIQLASRISMKVMELFIDNLRGKEFGLIPYLDSDQSESDSLKKVVWHQLEIPYQKLLNTFKSRFEEDTEIFEGIDTADVFAVFEQMAHMMLLFSPTRISADVTFDKSVILQGHYLQGSTGSFHFYWETFFPKDYSGSFHSSLNIYEDQCLIHTGGGNLEAISKQFAEIVFAQKTVQTI